MTGPDGLHAGLREARLLLERQAGADAGDREAQLALRRFERLATLGTTLAGAAHELNNPLAAIIGFAQLLRSRPLAAEDRAAVETILREAERTARIVRDLLSAVRQRESELPMPVNLNDVTGHVAGMRRYALETSGISCSLALDGTLPRVLADRAQLEQVVLNLLLNAEQALLPAQDGAASGAEIRIRTRREGEHAVLEISDNGPGIDANRIERIWEPFWTTRPEAGSGLGLSIVRGIVLGHGGTVHVRETPGGGATFEVRLPAAQDAASHEAGAPEDGTPPALDILIVDGDAEAREFLRAFLAGRGHAVLVADTQEEGMRLAERLEFQALVLDDRVADVAAFASALHRRDWGAGALVLVTGDAATSGETPEPTAGAPRLARLPKPYDLERLRRLIESR